MLAIKSILEFPPAKDALGKFVKDNLPDESEFFEVLWHQAKNFYDARPELRRVPHTSDQEFLEAVGFAGISNSGLTILRLFAVVINSLLKVAELIREPTASEIIAVFEEQAHHCKLPTTLRNPLVRLGVTFVGKTGFYSFAHGLSMAEIARIEGAEFEIYEDGHPYPADLEKVESLRNSKNAYAIWIDDTVPEILSYGKPIPLLPGQTDTYLTLVRLLERVGSYWTFEELVREGTCDPDALRRMGSTVPDLIRQRIRYINKILSKVLPKDAVEKWLSKGIRKRVDISKTLRTCLIRRLVV